MTAKCLKCGGDTQALVPLTNAAELRIMGMPTELELHLCWPCLLNSIDMDEMAARYHARESTRFARWIRRPGLHLRMPGGRL